MSNEDASGANQLFVKAQDAAKSIGMSESWFWNAVRSGKMPAGIHFGPKAHRWELSEVLEASCRYGIAKQTEKAGA